MVELKPRRDYLFGLDLIRFCSAMLVTLFHLGFASWASPMFPNPPYRMPGIENLAQPGWVGVDIFFVLSGFVIVSAAMSSSASGFAQGRALRLYPAAWICASLTLLCLLVQDADPALAGNYLRSMFLLPLGPWIDAQYWTLATEIAFYAIIFLMIWTRQQASLPLLALALTAASAVHNLGLILLDSYRLDQLRTVHFLPIYHGCHFATGIFLWLWSRGRLDTASTLGLACAIVTGVLQIQTGAAKGSERTFEAVGHAFSGLAPTMLWLAAILAIGLSVVHKARFDALPERVRRGMRTLGLMTYPLYLLHFAIGIALLELFAAHGVPALPALAATIALLCAAAYLVCAWLEPQLRESLRLAFAAIGNGARRAS